jgi:hypothetical protein
MAGIVGACPFPVAKSCLSCCAGAFLLFAKGQDTNWPAAIPDEPPTPIWELILEQFKDQLVLILLGSAAVSFGLALFEEEGGWSAFVDPVVVCDRHALFAPGPGTAGCILGELVTDLSRFVTDSHHPDPQRGCWRLPREQRGKSHRSTPGILGK